MFGVILSWQAAISALVAATGPSGLEFALLPTWMAVCAAEGRAVRAVLLFAATVLAAWLVGRSGGMSAYLGFVAGVGVPVGLLIQRNWRYDHAVAVAGLVGFAGVATALLWHWSDWIGEAAAAFATFRAELEAVADRNADMRYVTLVDVTRAILLDHWSDVGLGIVFWPVLLACGVSVGSASRLFVARSGRPGLTGGFSELRAPDALVWGVIALVLGWYADSRWPEVGIRPFVWNGAIAVAAVYWLTGMAVLAYGLRLARAPVVVRAAAYVGVNMLFGMPMPAAVGLSDTWIDYRARLQQWADARRSEDDADRRE